MLKSLIIILASATLFIGAAAAPQGAEDDSAFALSLPSAADGDAVTEGGGSVEERDIFERAAAPPGHEDPPKHPEPPKHPQPPKYPEPPKHPQPPKYPHPPKHPEPPKHGGHGPYKPPKPQPPKYFVICNGKRFGGPCGAIKVQKYPQCFNLNGVFNNQVSSARPAGKGVVCTLYDGKYCKGKSVTVGYPIPDLTFYHFNNKTSSVRCFAH